MFGSGGFGIKPVTTQPSSTNGLFSSNKSSLFGSTSQPSTGVFGQTNASSTSSTGFFNQNSQTKSLFGNTTTQSSIFGQPATENSSTGFLFSNPTTQQQSLFGNLNTNSTVFGSNVSNSFNPTTAFNSTPIGTTLKFVPITGNDTMMKGPDTRNIITKNMCITAMKQYEGKSLEELRVEDYIANRKTSQIGNTTGNLFNITTQQSTSNNQMLFRPNFCNQFSMSAATSQPGSMTSLFNNNKSSLFNVATSQPNTGLFGPANVSSAPATSFFNQNPQTKPLFTTSTANSNIFNPSSANSGTNSLFPNTLTQQQSSLFLNQAPNTNVFSTNNANSLNKPFSTVSNFAAPNANSSLFSLSQQNSTNLFTTTVSKNNTGFFPNNQSNTQSNIFPTNSSTQSNTIFNSTFQKPANLLFNPSTLATTNNFNSSTNSGMFTTPNVNPTFVANGNSSSFIISSKAQQEIIDAQLAVLPYGDSPLLKNTAKKSNEKTSDNALHALSPTNDSDSLKRQLRFLASKIDSSTANEKFNFNSTITTTTDVVEGSILSTTISSSSTSLNRLPVSSIDLNTSGLMNRTFSYKPLIPLPSVGFGAALGLTSSSNFLNSPTAQSLKNRSFLAHDTQDLEHSRGSNVKLSTTSPKRLLTGRQAKALDISVIHKQTAKPNDFCSLALKNIEENKETCVDLSTPLTRKINLNQQEEIKIPAINVDVISNSLSQEKNLSLKNQIDNSNTQNSDSFLSISSNNISAKETCKSALQQDAEWTDYYCEPSLEELQKHQTLDGTGYRIDVGLTIGRIGYGSVFWRGPFVLHNLNFDTIVFFRNKEVVVYPDEKTKPLVGEELNRPAEVSLEKIWPLGPNKILVKDPVELARLHFREKLEKLCDRMGTKFKDYKATTGTWQFCVEHFSIYGYFESVPTLIERNVVNSYQGISLEILENSFFKKLGYSLAPECRNSRRTCKVGFGQLKTFVTSELHTGYSPIVQISNVLTIKCIEEYLKEYLSKKNCFDELNDLKKTALLRWDPPSTFLKLIDTFIVKQARKNDPQLDYKIINLCDAILLPASSIKEIDQRVCFGIWLRKILIANEFNEISYSGLINEDDKFGRIYKLLLVNNIKKAIDLAKDFKFYNLAMLISLFKTTPGPLVQSQISKHLDAYRKLSVTKRNVYYERILELLSGHWNVINGQGDEVLHDDVLKWMYVLGIIVWYFAKPSTTLIKCIQLYDEKFSINRF